MSFSSKKIDNMWPQPGSYPVPSDLALYRLGRVHTNRILDIWYHSRMELTKAQYERIASFLPVQRGNVRVLNLQVRNTSLCYQAWLQMAGITVPVRALAYHRLHPDESLVEERGPRPGVRTSLEGTSRPDQAGVDFDGQYHPKGSSR